MQETYYSTFRETAEQQRRMDLGYSCEIISYGSGSSDDDSECYIEDVQTPPHTATEADTESDTEAATEAASYPQIDPNDPLRYFLELGQITPNEYDKWKLVKEEQEQEPEPEPHHRSKSRPDFGPGYNNDSDSDDDESEDGPTIEYGSGYSVWVDEHTDPFDPWNPTPDPTPDRRYAALANDGTFMMKRLTQSVQYEHSATRPGNKSNLKLVDSFELKLVWGRFTSASSPSQQFQTMQDFWQTNALLIYEALQDLIADHAKVRRNHRIVGLASSSPSTSTFPAPPPYHSTPIEVLENTFETIGRMSRCMAEDFNTPSIVAYVEEFIISLYREIEFNALVEVTETAE
jgi:hypothetical protein